MALSKITTESLLDGEITAAKFATNVGGRVVQVVNVQTGAVVSGTTVMPVDNTIPQNNEGVEMLTLAITPTHASNKLLIQFFGVVSPGDGVLGAALFQDSTAGALAAIWNATTTDGETITLSHYMAAGTTSATTFKIRIGGTGAGTHTLNGGPNGAGNRSLGGVSASSITITEILV